jgi:hypothetical protein
VKTEIETFDGLDNRREVMILLERLGSDGRRAKFLESLIPSSLKGFAGCPMKVRGNCDPVAAYYMLVGVCNELGVSINEAARRLEKEIKKGVGRAPVCCA